MYSNFFFARWNADICLMVEEPRDPVKPITCLHIPRDLGGYFIAYLLVTLVLVKLII